MRKAWHNLVLGILVWTAAGGHQRMLGQGVPATEHYEWKSVNIGGGGFVSGIITHPAEKGLVYARTDVGGAYRWEKDTWVPITDWVMQADWTLTGIESIAVDANDAERVYVAAGTYTNNWSGPGAILRSTDRGKTFARTNLPIKLGGNEDGRSMGERLAVDPNMGAILFFGSRHDGLWKSEDHAATWERVKSFPDVPEEGRVTRAGAAGNAAGTLRGTGVGVVHFDSTPQKQSRMRPTQHVFASTDGAGIYESNDAGATWKQLAGQPAKLLVHHMVLDSDGTLYVTYCDGPGPNGVGGGAVWKRGGDGKWTDISPVKQEGNDHFGYAGLTVDARHAGVVMISTLDRWNRGDEIYRSTDAGVHWKPINPTAKRNSSATPWVRFGKPEAPMGHWIGDVEIDPFDAGHVMYITGWGMWESHDVGNVDEGKPTHWTVTTKGIEECVINKVISPPNDGRAAFAGNSYAPLLSAMWDIGGFRHEDLNVSPANGMFNPQEDRNVGIDFAEQRPAVMARVYGGKGTHGSYSEDNGRTWKAFAGTADARGDGSIAVAADGFVFVWAVEGGQAYWTIDKGATWTACEGLPARTRVISDRMEARTFYAIQRQTGKLFVSTDGGKRFTERASGLKDMGQGFEAVPGYAGHVWLAQETGLTRSVDGGTTFEKIAGVERSAKIGFGKPAPGAEYPAVFISGTVKGTYGFYRSDDQGVTWVRVNDDQHQFGGINTISGDPRVYGRIYIGTTGRGIVYGEIAGGK